MKSNKTQATPPHGVPMLTFDSAIDCDETLCGECLGTFQIKIYKDSYCYSFANIEIQGVNTR